MTDHKLKAVAKKALRNLVPERLRQQRGIIARLGPQAGRTYAELRLLDAIGLRAANGRLAPEGSRKFLFVCFGNIMRSAMAEFLMRQLLRKSGFREDEQITIKSAGLHAVAGNEAHPWAQAAAEELGVSLAAHRAKLLTQEMVEKAECVFPMDFQNKAELLTLYPEARNKIYMLSAYAEGSWRNREIPDPYHGDIEVTKFCCGQLQICVRNLVATTVLKKGNHKKAKGSG